LTTVLWLKATPPKGVAWPEGTRHAIVEVPPDLRGAGKDARPPSAYRSLWDRHGSLKALLDHYAPGWTAPVGLVSFSAGYGLAEQLLKAEPGLASVLLADSAFGARPWPGYEAAIASAAAGRSKFTAVTGTTGGDTSFLPAWEGGTRGFKVEPARAVYPALVPSRGVLVAGRATLLRYGPELLHQNMGAQLGPWCSAYLVPGLHGVRAGAGKPAGGGGVPGAVVALGVLGLGAVWWAGRRR
jgi:hypothetical protein